MKVIIPMAGLGERFIRAGYALPKPLIEVDNRAIISYVLDLFSKNDEFVFICNEEHVRKFAIGRFLKKLVPNAVILSIPSHKLGPVYTVSTAFDYIKDEEEVIVNYCDFNAYWDYGGFKKTVRQANCDGAVTAYKGFHPHLLGDNLYASMRVDKNNQMLEVKEKHSFTANKMDSFQQAGTFYFAKGALVKKYFKELMNSGKTVNGEYYVSMVFDLMQKNDLNICVYPLEFFLQWGTPEDLREYEAWVDYFKKKSGGIAVTPPSADKRTLEYWTSYFKKIRRI